MQTADVVIRLATLEGHWEVCGVDRLRGVVPDPDSLILGWDGWGPQSCGFVLRRDPRAIHPDLAAFTPCKIDVAGVTVWSGRVRETPSRDGDDRQITVQGEGWQYHLDDDTYQRSYVHADIGEWKDIRSNSNAQLGAADNFAAGQVSSEGGLTLMIPTGTVMQADSRVAALLDLGEESTGTRISLDYRTSNNNNVGQIIFQLFGVEGADESGFIQFTGSGAALTTLTAGPSTITYDLAGDKRYILIRLIATGAMTISGDCWITFSRITVYASDAYHSANQSILQADDVVKDARDRSTILLSTSNDLIPSNDSIFNIPDFRLSGDRTPREVIQAVNAYEDNECAIDVEKRLIFRNKASRPVLEVGEWAGAEFSDASMNSGQEIYNRVIVQGQGADGTPMRVERYTANLAGTAIIPLTTPSNSNPSFDTNTTGWTHNVGTFARDTVDFDSTPASGRADVSTGGTYFVQSPAYSGTFEAGRTYKLTVWIAVGTDSEGYSWPFTLKFGEGSDRGITHWPAVTSPLTATRTVVWTPTTDRTAVNLRVEFTTTAAASQAIFVDTLTLYEARNATLVDRRGFRRTKILPVQSALTEAMANQIGDTFLRGHQVTPFKGDLTVTGQGGVRRGLGGAGVHPAHLGLEVNQLIRFADRVNPDSGGWGRTGRIVAVSYKHSDQQASVSLDSTSGNLEALLARLDVVTGQVR